jgi:hypothetical protein
MTGKKKASLPPSPEARDEVLTHIRSSATPLAARELAKRLSPSHKMAAADLETILEEHVAAGTLRLLPSKTMKSKPRYWDRDPRAVCFGAAVEAVQRTDGPHTAKELLRGLLLPIKLTEAELSQILDEAAGAGKLHVIPPATAKGKPRYWNRDALTYGRLEILKALNDKGPLSESALKMAAKGFSDAQIRQMIDAALAAAELWRHPPLGKSKKELIGRQAPAPELYLREAGAELTRIVAQLRSAGVRCEELRRVLVQIVEATGVSYGSAAAAGQTLGDSPRTGSVDLVALMRRIEPGADRGALVGSRDLRRAANLDKPLFDRAVLELARQGRVSLHRHDYATSLTAAERDELVTDGAGTYYVGVALRNGAGH